MSERNIKLKKHAFGLAIMTVFFIAFAVLNELPEDNKPLQVCTCR